MKIKGKILLSLTFISLLVSAGIFLVFYKSITNTFGEIEKETINSNIMRIHEFLKGREDELNVKIGDWAHWDDVYDYVNTKNKRFIDVNLTSSALESFKIDALFIYNSKKELIFKDDHQDRLFYTDILAEELLNSAHVAKLKSSDFFSGLIRIDEEIYLFSVAKIYKTDTHAAPSNGYMIFLKNFDMSELELLKKVFQFGFAVNLKVERKTIKLDSLIVFPYYIKDYKQNRIGTLQVVSPRIYSVLESKIIKIIIVGIVLLNIVFFGCLYYFINKMILKPLHFVRENSSVLSEKDIQENLVNVNGQDEFSDLAFSIHDMLNEKMKIQKQIQHQLQLSSLGEMASGIAHEINNPLSIIVLSSEKIKKRFKENLNDDPELEKSLNKILTTSHRIAKIVKGMRALSKKTEPEDKENLCLPLLVEETLDFFKERFRDLDVKLDLEIEDYNFWIYANITQISQVVVNLTSNALDAMEKNTQKKLRITIGSVHDKKDEFCFLAVCDNGIGIDPAIKDKILQPFFTTKEGIKGTGLGLSITSEILNGHNARLEINSAEGYTEFKVIFPRGKAKRNAA